MNPDWDRRCNFTPTKSHYVAAAQMWRVRYVSPFQVYIINPAQVTSEHKHRCCPCKKWANFLYSLVLV